MRGEGSNMTDASAQARLSPRGADEPWWRSAVVYQIYIRSFADGDGDLNSKLSLTDTGAE